MSLSHIYSNITQLTYHHVIESFLVMHLRKNKRWGFMTAVSKILEKTQNPDKKQLNQPKR